MRKQKKVWSTGLLVILAVMVCANITFAKENKEDAKEVSILFTHDLHSHLESTQLEDGSTIGGSGKLKTFIEEKKTKNPKTFVFDGGDFSMGTLYQTVYENKATELTMLGRIGFDATTIGNHEFDYRGEGFANMLNSAKRNAIEDPSLQLPQLLSANIDWKKNSSEDNEKVKQALEDYGSSAYTIIERDGIKMGVFGVMGRDSEACAPESGIVFEDIIETSKVVVKELKEEKVDMIVCLSHSGTQENKKKSEDELLAKAVPEIDVIVSGHTHSILEKPIRYENTYIVSAGSYGINLGEITLTEKKNSRWEIADYQLHPMNDAIVSAPEVSEYINDYKAEVNENYLKYFGYTYDQVIADNPIDFRTIEELLSSKDEDTLGNLLSDSYVYAVKQAEGEAYEAVDVAMVPSGVVRESLDKGEVTVSEAFNISSLGIGPDRIPGYPLVSVYLTGKELKTAAEVDASVSQLMDGVVMYPSGMGWEYNPNRLLLNRVVDVWKIKEDGTKAELVGEKLYRVVADLYSAQMLGAVESQSFGLLSLVPKDKEGNTIKDFERHIVKNKIDATEVKEWVALANYLESFDKENGVSTIASKYQAVEGRKIITDSKNIFELIKNPNKIAFIVCGVIMLIIVLFISIIFTIRHIIKKNKKKKNMLY